MPTWTKAFGQYVNLIVTATESEVSVANNTSKVTVNAKLHYHTGQTTTSNWNAISYYLKIDGTSYVSKPKTTSNGYSLSSSSRYKDLGTYSKTITHDSNGSKSINVYVDFDDHAGWRALANETMALTTIARASIPTASVTSIAIGSAITINTNRKSSSFRHELTFKFASRAVDTLMTTASTADRVTWTLPNDMANAIPNSTSNGGTFTLKTYNGSTLVGTNTISITVTVPNNSTFNPTMGTPSYTDVGASSVTGVIDGKSKLNFTGTASPKMGATVKSIKLNFSRPGYSTSYDISRSGNVGTYSWSANTVATWSVSMTVTDSRGRSATSGSISIPVVAYSTPKLSVKASRSGSSIVLSGNATGASLSSSNTLTLETYIRTRGTTSWGTVVNTATSTTGTVAPTVTTYSGYATTTSYEVRVRVKDELSDWTESILPITTKKVLLDIYKDIGVGIGKYYETNIGGPLQVGSGTSVFDGGIHVKGPLFMEGGIQPIFLGANTDLNTLIKPGFYYANSNANVATMKNCPVVSAFSLQVELHAGYKQTLTVYLTNNILTLVRNHYAGTWGEWYSYYEGSAVETSTYSSFLNGYSGIFTFRKVSNLVYFEGYFQATGTARVESDHNLFYPDAKYAPTTHLRLFCAPWGASTNFPESQGAILRIEPAKVAVEKSTARSVRFYAFGCYMTNSNVR